MGRIGREIPYSEERGPNGRRMCAWCQKIEVGKGRRKYCSEACSEAYGISRNPSFARNVVLLRDGFRCTICGFDAKAVASRVNTFTESVRSQYGKTQMYAYKKQVIQCFSGRGFSRVGGGNGYYYHVLCAHEFLDVDHIIPVVEGGKSELSNLRTLCCVCHKAETKALRQRLAKRGKKEQQTKLMLALSQTNANVAERIQANG